MRATSLCAISGNRPHCSSLCSFRLLKLGVATVFAGRPISNVHVTLRGKKYDISDVTTVQDLQARVQKAAGLTETTAIKHTVLFGGKRLEASDVLSEVGVEEGSQLNMIPGTSSTSAKSSSKPQKTTATATTTSSTEAAAGTEKLMSDYLKESGVDMSNLDDLMKGMGGGEGAPSLEESMKQMQTMMNSPMFQEYMSNPERLEESRQMILNNPMLKGMMSGMPGMEELLNDPEKWREAMMAAGDLYKNMNPDDLMKAMSGSGMPPGLGGPGGAGGLFDGTLENSAAAAALDELDEED